MTWRKIEVEFLDDSFDVEQSKENIRKIFTNSDGICLAQVSLVEDGDDLPDVPDHLQNIASNLVAQMPNADDMAKLAILRNPNSKIDAIKDLRQQAFLAGNSHVYGLKEAKDMIDKHWKHP